MIIKVSTNDDKNLKIKFPSRNESLAEFMGILTGDGFINYYKSRQAYIIEISGNKLKDYYYLKNFITKLSKNLFNFKPCFYSAKKTNTIRLVLRSKHIFNFLKEGGFPIGKKGEITAPKWIIKDSLLFNKFIMGLFDTDGYLCFKNKEGKKYPVIGIVSKSKALLLPIQKHLNNCGITSYLGNHKSNNNPRYKNEWIVYKLQISGKKNIHKFFDIVGSSNPRNKKNYRLMGMEGIEPPDERASVVCLPTWRHPQY